MTVLAAQSIRSRVESGIIGIDPFEPDVKQFRGMSYGVTAAGYDIRLGSIRHPRGDNAIVERLHLGAGQFILAAAMEYMVIPNDLQVTVHDKSTWARQGLAVQTTVLEPGWYGHITLELSNHSNNPIELMTGMPIAQLVFHQLDAMTDRPYVGKYQNQSVRPQPAILEPDVNSEETSSADKTTFNTGQPKDTT